MLWRLSRQGVESEALWKAWKNEANKRDHIHAAESID